MPHEAEPRVSANRVPPNFYQPSHLAPLTSVLSPLSITTSRAPLDVSLKSQSPLSGAHSQFTCTTASTRSPKCCTGTCGHLRRRRTSVFGECRQAISKSHASKLSLPLSLGSGSGMVNDFEQRKKQHTHRYKMQGTWGWEALAELSFQFPTPTLSPLLTKRTLTLSVPSCVGRSHMSHAPSKAHFKWGLGQSC
ncbi:hypothetical protein EDB85DRAFT_1564101 [Lactarius pseudohatsudake]|nr:hypothetical protein EDB85DRAFT_1564101 [Lactarius pseudohatsudake]